MTTLGPTSDLAVGLRDGSRMPLIGFGTWRLRDRDAQNAVAWALEAGYRHFDTATIYRNQSAVGAALRDSGVPRDEVFVTTKLPPERANQAVDTLSESLRELDTEYLDLWLIHAPPARSTGVDAWRAFATAQTDGLVRSVGVSNYTLDQIDHLADATGVVPAVNQIEWGPYLFDRATLDGHRDRGIVVEGYSPFLSTRMDDPTLTGIAEEYGKTVAQVIIRWHVQHGVVVIPKSANRDRIESNADVTDFELDERGMAAIDGLSTG